MGFDIWAYGDAHVGTDSRHGRSSLADAIKQSEGFDTDAPGFDWDIAIDVGDNSGAQGLPGDDEGKALVEQLGAMTQHRRGDIYSVCGNHDRSGLEEEEAWWFQKYLDPMGKHSESSGIHAPERPFAVEGTWERYSFRVGNLLFLMMSDVNETSQPLGRGTYGGNPGGVVRRETFEWWKAMVENNQDCNIITVHHYVLKDTTVASGEWEGLRRDSEGNWKSHYHGYKPHSTPNGASYLYWVGGKADSNCFGNYLEKHPGCISMWLGGHTHTNPDDTFGNKSHIEKKWGVTFMNVAALTQHHVKVTSTPMSRHLHFEGGSNELLVRCYLHTDGYAPKGWYAPAERRVSLQHPLVLAEDQYLCATN